MIERRRATDPALKELRSDVMDLRDELKAHIEEETEDLKINNKIARENSESIKRIEDSTKDLVEAWGELKTATKLGVRAGNVIKWGAGIFAAVVAAWMAWPGNGK